MPHSEEIAPLIKERCKKELLLFQKRDLEKDEQV